MKHVHTPHLANELIGQAHNVCITKLVNPETAAHASQRFGEYEELEEDESITESRGGGRSRTVSRRRVKRQAVMPSELMSIPMPSPESGLTFYAITASLEAYFDTMPGEVVASMLCPANADPARGGMANSEPVPTEWQKLRPWDAADYARLGMTPPLDVIVNEHAANEPKWGSEKTPQGKETPGCQRRRKNEPQSRSLIEGAAYQIRPRSARRPMKSSNRLWNKSPRPVSPRLRLDSSYL